VNRPHTDGEELPKFEVSKESSKSFTWGFLETNKVRLGLVLSFKFFTTTICLLFVAIFLQSQQNTDQDCECDGYQCLGSQDYEKLDTSDFPTKSF